MRLLRGSRGQQCGSLVDLLKILHRSVADFSVVDTVLGHQIRRCLSGREREG